MSSDRRNQNSQNMSTSVYAVVEGNNQTEEERWNDIDIWRHWDQSKQLLKNIQREESNDRRVEYQNNHILIAQCASVGAF